MFILAGLFVVFTVLIVALAFGALIWAVISYGQRQRREYIARLVDFARKAGLEFMPATGSWLTRRPAHVAGAYRDHPVVLDSYTVSNGKSSTTYQRMTVGPADLRGLDLKLGSENFLTRIFQAFGGSDVKIGDPRFDDGLFVRSDTPGRVREILSENALREKLAAVVQDARGGVRTEGGALKWAAAGTGHSPELLLLVADTLCDLADAAESGS